MKKTLVALMALAGVSMAAETTVEVNTSIMSTAAPTWVTKSSIGGVTWTNATWGSMYQNKNASERAASLTADFKLLGITDVGHYAFNSTGEAAANGKAPTYNDETGAFTLTGGGAFYANVQSVSDIVQGYDLTSLDSLTVTFVGGYSGDSNDTFYAIYKMDSEGTLTTLVDMYSAGSSLKNTDGNVWTDGSVTRDYDTSSWGLQATDKIVMLVNHNTDKVFTISDMYVTAGATVTIPEPTTATLSLLALAGLAARRRRR